jgi:phosphoglucosamine mutase
MRINRHLVMGKQYFGTDGIRGRVGQAPITPDFMMRLGYAAGRVLVKADQQFNQVTHPTVLIGKDTRLSGYLLESALQAGLCAAGVDVRLTGPMPTPAIAYLTRALRAQAGIVISASHNPFEDNGIKFFSSQGLKLPDTLEKAIEAELALDMEVVAPASLGKVKRIDDAAGRYIEFCKSTFPNDQDLRGLKIVLDCANGADYHVAPHVFHELGAEVVSMNIYPNGMNINLNCGSTHPSVIAKAVLEHHADLGIAFDGDGDRVVMVDHLGNILDGDQLVYIIAMHRYMQGTLHGGVVGTHMTNLAVEHALKEAKIPFLRTNVGDRYVLEKLLEKGWHLGGENSGHIICLDKHSSGDGIVAALQVLSAVRAQSTTLALLGKKVSLYPQVLLNVPISKPIKLEQNEAIQAAVQAGERSLNGMGRILLRASGTEPKIRVMVEGHELGKVQQVASEIAEIVSLQLK